MTTRLEWRAIVTERTWRAWRATYQTERRIDGGMVTYFIMNTKKDHFYAWTKDRMSHPPSQRVEIGLADTLHQAEKLCEQHLQGLIVLMRLLGNE